MPTAQQLIKLPEAEGTRVDSIYRYSKKKSFVARYLELVYKLRKKKEYKKITSRLPKNEKEEKQMMEFLGLKEMNYYKVKKTDSWAWKYYLLKWQYAQFML